MNVAVAPPGVSLRGVDLDRSGPLFRDLALDLPADEPGESDPAGSGGWRRAG